MEAISLPFEDLAPPPRMERVKSCTRNAPLLRAIRDLTSLGAHYDDPMHDVIASRRNSRLVYARDCNDGWFIVVHANDHAYDVGYNKSGMNAWAMAQFGCCAYGMIGCQEEYHTARRDDEVVSYTVVPGLWKQVRHLRIKPFKPQPSPPKEPEKCKVLWT